MKTIAVSRNDLIKIVCQLKRSQNIFTGLYRNELTRMEDSVFFKTGPGSYPGFYYVDLFTPVCSDTLCKPVYIILIWDLAGALGGAVAAWLAGQVTAGAIILESTFSSARDFARSVFPLLSRVVILRYEFDAARAIRRNRSPLLILHSRDDEIMPFALGRKLYIAALEPKRFVTLRGDHNAGFMVSRPDYDRAINDFLTASLTKK